MNEQQRQHAREVADAIERHAGQYNQRRLQHSCGTPACVAGWSIAIAKAGRERAAATSIFTCNHPIDRAQENLGLTYEESEVMFGSHPYGGDAPDATAAEAVAMLRQYAETDEVCWPTRGA